MNDMTFKTDLQNIIVSEIFPHSAKVIWKVLSDGGLMAQWLMAPTGFAPIVGTAFTFQTTPANNWDGIIDCLVLEVVADKRLAFSWRGGHEANIGYGSKLDTIVTFTLAAVEGGTRVLMVHSGFEIPKNNSAFEKMSVGWKTVVGKLGEMAGAR